MKKPLFERFFSACFNDPPPSGTLAAFNGAAFFLNPGIKHMNAGSALLWMVKNESRELKSRGSRITARFNGKDVEVKRKDYVWVEHTALAFIRIYGELTFTNKWSLLNYFQQDNCEKPLLLGHAGCLTKG